MFGYVEARTLCCHPETLQGKEEICVRTETARKTKENRKIISSCAQIHANAISLTHKGGGE